MVKVKLGMKGMPQREAPCPRVEETIANNTNKYNDIQRITIP